MSENTEEHEIRKCAYALWQEAGSPEGQETEFWQKAKAIIARRKAYSEVDAAGEDSFPASDAVNHM